MVTFAFGGVHVSFGTNRFSGGAPGARARHERGRTRWPASGRSDEERYGCREDPAATEGRCERSRKGRNARATLVGPRG